MKMCHRVAYLLLYLAIGSSFMLCAQQLTLHIRLQPALHVTDTIFVAGNFNNWQPNNYGYAFHKDGQNLSLQIKNVPTGIIEFKCTRGSWQKTECAANGANVANHTINVTTDTTIGLSIEGWKDDFADNGKQHTASQNVRIIDTAFVMPQLGRTRRIWIYLPADYATSSKRYPVMYMHDGQNIFDAYTAFAGEWEVDETLDALIKMGTPPCIVVGIDNGPERMTEYNPYTFEKFGKGEGDKYVDFLVKTLKPFIDSSYRTVASKENTIIAGSSMGGLISYYALLKYPGVFGKAGVFSPSFWIADKIKKLTDTNSNKLTGKLFFYIGALEGDSNVKNMEAIVNILGEKSPAIIYSVVDPEGQHNEQAWRKWFVAFYKWIMADGFNSVIEEDK